MVAALVKTHLEVASGRSKTSNDQIDNCENKKRTRVKRTTNTQKTERDSRMLAFVRLLSCMIVVLIVIGVAIYFFVAAKRLQSTTRETTPPNRPTSRPSSSFPKAFNPSTPLISTSTPSSSPTLSLLFDPPLQEDCDLVRAGEAVLGQDSLVEESFDLILDVDMRVHFGQSETMDLLESEIQKLLMPKLVGCGEVPNKKLIHHRMLNNPSRYIIANGKIRWRPSSLEEKSDCLHPMCLSAVFNMDLFVKKNEYFVVMNLVADVIGGDLVDSLQLQSLPFISVVVRSVIRKNPTTTPSSLPTKIPSTSPSQHPSESPSKMPSLVPTVTPTQGPTIPPTPRPTLPPTRNPTPSPTTSSPTFRPTRRPTPAPTPSPSTTPTEVKDHKGYYDPLDRPIRIACVGDSLTKGTSNLYGLGAVDYPKQLQGLLGGMYTHRNLGINSVTAIRGLSTSYTDRWGFETSLTYQPDIYLLMLGTNDSKYWETQGQKYRGDMEWIVRTVKAETGARIIVGIPPYVKDPASGFGEIRNQILVNFIQPAIRDLVISENVEIVDMYKVTVNVPDALTNDGVHLNEKGYGIIAEAWRSTIQCNQNGECDVGESCNACPHDCFLNCD